MYDKAVPLGLCPSQVLFLDDNILFLNALRTNLKSSKFISKFFWEPDKLLTWLDNKQPYVPFFKRSISYIDEEEYDYRRIEVNLRAIHKEIYNPWRFEQVSCVIVDYDMPNKNGIEVCQAIKDPSIQKILLTGATDQQIAVEAFNSKIIDKFVQKHDINLLDNLINIVLETQERYFQLNSEMMSNIILKDPQRFSIIADPEFKAILKQVIQTYNIVEYYIIDPIGCFLMLDNTGKAYGLFVADEDSMKFWESEARHSSKPEATQLAELFAKRETLLCYYNLLEPIIPPINEWHPYLKAAKKVETPKYTYYWAFTSDVFSLESLVSLDKYIELLKNGLLGDQHYKNQLT